MGPAAGLPADPLARARWGGQSQRVSKHPAATPSQTMAPRRRPTIRCRRYCPVNTRALCGRSGMPKSRPCPSTPSTTHGNVLRPLEDPRQSLASSGHAARSVATTKDPPQQRGRLLTRAGYRGRPGQRYCGYGTGTLGRGGVGSVMPRSMAIRAAISPVSSRARSGRRSPCSPASVAAATPRRLSAPGGRCTVTASVRMT